MADNPFDQFDTEQPETTNPFDQFDMPTQTEVLSGEDPLMNDLNKMRETGEFDKIPEPSNSENLLKSEGDLYTSIREKPEYSELNKYENSLLHIGAVSTPWGDYSLQGKTPPELMELKKRRNAELQAAYEGTGQADTFKIPENIPLVGGMDTGIDYRTQEVRTNNPNFNPSLPEGVDNPAMASTKYVVDPPDRFAINRMAYQIAQNIVGGIGDFATEGKLTSEGEIGASLPETVPETGTEQFVTELSTYILGPKVIEKGVKGAVNVAKGGALIAKTASLLSPEAVNSVRTIYQTTLNKTGSAVKAYSAANSLTKRLVIGASFGLTEGVVAPNNAEGIIDPETVQKYMGVSPERARDVSFLLDSPIIQGTVGALGRAYTIGRDNFVLPVVGGLRNFSPAGLDIGRGINKITITEKAAGLKTITWLDENITSLPPEDAVFKIKVLGDALERNSKKLAQINTVSKEVKMDTPAAFSEVAKDYYSLAYGNLKESMGPKEFNDWVSEQADKTANRLFELRTAVIGNTEVLSKTSKGAKDIENLYNEGSDSFISNGNLAAGQEEAGRTMAGTQIDRITNAEDQLRTAKTDMDLAKDAASKSISGDADIKLLMDQMDNPLGVNKEQFNQLEGMSDKVFQSLKTMKTGVDDAYKNIAKSGAEGDPSSFLQTIQDSGMADDPFFKKLAEDVNANPSFDNMYNKVRNRISNEVSKASSANDMNRRNALLALKDNINETQLDWLRANGDEDVVKMVDDAKRKYVDYVTTFKDNSRMRQLTDLGEARLRGEKLPAGLGPGQGVSDFKIDTIRLIQQNLDSAEGNIYRESLDRAVKAGGQNIDSEIANYYATKALSNLSDKVTSGGKEGVGTLRRAVRSYAETLEKVNSPLAERLKRLESDIQTLDNTASNKEEIYNTVKEKTEELRKMAQNSVLEQFVYKGKEPITGTGKVLKKIYNAPDAENQIRELYAEADALGDQGKIIKEAIQGTYIDNIADKIVSKRPLGLTGVSDKGTPETAFKINESNFNRIFDPRSEEMKVMRTVFADKPQVVKQLEDVSSLYLRLTKSTPNAKGDVLGAVPKDLNPETAIGSLIYIFAGPLSRKGTVAKRITGPISIQNLEQVREGAENTLITMLKDPEEFAKIADEVAKGIDNKELRARAARAVSRALAKTVVSGPDQEDNPMTYKVPLGLR